MISFVFARRCEVDRESLSLLKSWSNERGQSVLIRIIAGYLIKECNLGIGG